MVEITRRKDIAVAKILKREEIAAAKIMMPWREKTPRKKSIVEREIVGKIRERDRKGIVVKKAYRR